MWNKLRPGQQADLAIRTVASSLYTGLPSTLRGETAPEQVYEYLLGSYFGFSTLPQETKNARAFIVKYNADSRKGFRDPASYEGFGNFSERTQKAIRDYSVEQIQGGKLISLKKMAEAMGLKPAQIKAMLPTIGEKENLVNGANEPLLMKQYLIDPGEKLFAPVAYSIVDKINLEELGIKKIYGIEYVTRNKGNKLSLVNEENNSISLDTNKMREMYENNTYKKEPWWPTVKKVVKDFPNYLKFEEFITFMERAKINSPRGDGEIDNNEAYYTRIANIVKTIYNSETLPKENVTHIVEDFVTKNLELIYGKDRKRKAEVMDEVQRRWDELQPIDDNTGYVNSNAMLDWLKTTYEIKIDDATEMFWRQQGTRRAHGVKRALLAFNSQTNELEEVLDGRGKTKTLFAPPTVFETILNEKGKMNEPMRVVEQILTYEGYENLNELQQNKREIYNVEVQKLDTKMRDDGYYYFGGKGDKARRIYIKHHPDAGDPEVLKQIDKYLEETSWDSIQEDMKRLSPNQKVEYMKMTYSNILYDLEANFNTLNLNNLPKLSDPHMINSAMAWNKRAQVLFADAYPVDEIYIKYFNEITEKLVDDKGTIGTILVNDHKNLSQTDGSIRYIKDIVDAYNRQAGLDGSGGTAKLFTYFPGDEGAFISKGMTGANFEKEADYIAEHYGAVGIDYVSSAKQSGSRPIYDIEVNEKGESFFYETVNGKRI
ncbi:MAG: hypothetical protein KKC76_21300, partial [Proteobacteria bacterium]|nr:hypothetical protein [Pseudomonadota bacterium]